DRSERWSRRLWCAFSTVCRAGGWTAVGVRESRFWRRLQSAGQVFVRDGPPDGLKVRRVGGAQLRSKPKSLLCCRQRPYHWRTINFRQRVVRLVRQVEAFGFGQAGGMVAVQAFELATSNQ